MYNVGDDVTLMCSGDGGPGNVYQWQVNSSDIDGATLPTLTLTNIQSSAGGEYTCIVTNEAGSDDASTFLYVSPHFNTQPSDQLTVNGSSISLLCDAQAFPSPDYQWIRVDGEPIRAGIPNSTPMLVINPVMFGDEGDYYCNATSLNAIVQSSVATITGILC